MSNNIQLHKNDLPEDLKLGNIIAVDGEFMGLNVRRDPLCLIQISSGNSDTHIVQFDRKNYDAPNLVKILGIILGFLGIVYLFSENLLINDENLFSALMILVGSTFYVIGGILTLKISPQKSEVAFKIFKFSKIRI